MKKILKYFTLISVASLMAVNFASASQQQASLRESFDKIKESVQEVNEGTKNLITAKEQENLSPAEKEKEELNLRLEVYGKILNLSTKETKDALDQLKALGNLNEKASFLREQLAQKFEGFLEFYNEQKKTLEKPEKIAIQQAQDNAGQNQAIDLSRIKEMAQFFKDWREAIYLPELKVATNFLQINRQKTTMEMAENRFKKITSDIKKLKKINFKGVNELGKYLDLAANYLKEARDLRQEAENNFWLIMASSTITTASSTATSTSIEIATSTEEIANPAGDTASTSVSTSISISTEDQFLSIKSLMGQSLNKIKEAYQIFIEMSNFVKKLLI